MLLPLPAAGDVELEKVRRVDLLYDRGVRRAELSLCDCLGLGGQS